MSRGEGDLGVRGRFGGGLYGRIPSAGDRDALLRKRLRRALLGRVQHRAGEALQPR
ncbi:MULTISPECIES: hypothetical protein [Streptomyces]|uniref:Uncharacterized protein n=2 Tax=Streptomyces TaxID=1883 RepID=A0ABV9J660_9ACTN